MTLLKGTRPQNVQHLSWEMSLTFMPGLIDSGSFMRVGGSLPNPPPSGSHHPSYMEWSPCPSDVFNQQACLCGFVPHQSVITTPSKSLVLEAALPSPPVQPNCDVAPVLLPPHSSQWLPSTHDIDHLDSRTARFCPHSWGLRGVSLRQGPLTPAP
ncbi:hypothetical protein LY76DRAFT_87631 [Colletotrichum caudatum]|nr:hypothetical protein LY76DRAFT_87631 [Colletotrichum caudatum]